VVVVDATEREFYEILKLILVIEVGSSVTKLSKHIGPDWKSFICHVEEKRVELRGCRALLIV
jgi:hypothetical protein